jgi:hypothetical protein
MGASDIGDRKCFNLNKRVIDIIGGRYKKNNGITICSSATEYAVY